MSILKILDNPYSDKNAIRSVSEYITDYTKTYGVVGGNGILPSCVAITMKLINNTYEMYNGKQILHFILSFAEWENINVKQAAEIANLICDYFKDYTMVYGVHQDSTKLHIHFGVNPINRIDLSKLNFTKPVVTSLLSHIETILGIYGIGCRKIYNNYTKN